MTYTASSTETGDLLALLSRGICEASSGNKTSASLCFRQVLALEQDNETALLWMAWLASDPFEAEDLLERVLARNPKNSVARAYLIQARARRQEAEFSSADSVYATSSFDRTVDRFTQSTGNVVPFLGEFLLRMGYITHQQLEVALREHRRLGKTGKPKRIGQVLIDMGYLTPVQLEAGLRKQRDEYNAHFNA